ncbi:MAG: murein biosynthesis integral membrane protein MurJ [Candidatus Doudnabacteria bacterium]|nr:murein biosynthesis integral membrane protein MurJ [Candidatus Doudnabacteria bacterium]
MDKDNQQGGYIQKATVVIAVFSLLAKILGLARDAIFSHNFGTSVVIDAYFAAFRIPDFIFNLLILGTFSVAFIPIFSQYLAKDREEANRLASSIINATLLGILFLCLLALVFIDPLVSIIAPGFKGEARHLTKVFTMIFLASPIFLTLSSIVSSMLNSYKRFALVSLAPVVYNLSIILGVVLLYPKMGPAGLALGVVIGAFLHFGVQLPQLFSLKFSYKLILDRTQPGFIKFWKLYWPRIFSMGTGQVTLLIATFFGSFLASGSLSAFYYANNLQSVFLSVFAVSISIAVFPLLSDLFNKKNEAMFRDVIAKTAVQILFFIIPLSTLLLIMRAQVVRLILGIGQNTQFTFSDTKLVSLTVGLFSISLFAQSLIPLFARAFYARHNTKTPVIIGFITIAANVIATYFLVRRFGVPGMAMSFSITSIVELIMLTGELRHKLGHLHDEYLIIASLKIIISSIAAGAATYVSLGIVAPVVNMQTYLGILIQTGISGIVGVIAFLAAGFILNLPESRDLINLSRSLGSKFARPLNILWDIWS